MANVKDLTIAFIHGFADEGATKNKPKPDSPKEFKFSQWKKALLATKEAMAAKRLGILAAGIAFFTTLSFFPMMAAAVGIASFVMSPEQIQSVVIGLEAYLPADIASLVTTQLETALQDRSSSFIIAMVAILVALFSVSGSVTNLISASNATYDRKETRNFIKQRLTALGIMIIGGVIGALVIGLLILNEPILAPLGVPAPIITLIGIARWFVIAVLISIALAAFYRYGPDRPNAKWQWVSWGSVIATVLWMVATAIFFVYARFFADFSESYSVFAGIIVLMTWLNFTSLIILLGAEVNHRLEEQTAAKTSE